MTKVVLLTAFDAFECKRTDGGGSPSKRTPLGSLRTGIGAAPKRVPPPSSRTPARRALHTPAQRSAAGSSRDRAAAGSRRDSLTAGKDSMPRDAQNGASSSPPGRKRDSAQLDSVQAADGRPHASKVKHATVCTSSMHMQLQQGANGVSGQTWTSM